jgi:hypothetical protein
MKLMTKLKLSELEDDIEVGRDGSVDENWTVGELKHEIINLGESHHKHTDWCTLKPETWRPDAESMISQYIENEYQDMYEDWDERANDCITPEHIAKIQAVLDDAFKDGHATQYWSYDKPVEIDILPTPAPKEGEA